MCSNWPCGRTKISKCQKWHSGCRYRYLKLTKLAQDNTKFFKFFFLLKFHSEQGVYGGFWKIVIKKLNSNCIYSMKSTIIYLDIIKISLRTWDYNSATFSFAKSSRCFESSSGAWWRTDSIGWNFNVIIWHTFVNIDTRTIHIVFITLFFVFVKKIKRLQLIE